MSPASDIRGTVTMLALTLAAQFSFDLQGRASCLRTSGKPERPGAA